MRTRPLVLLVASLVALTQPACASLRRSDAVTVTGQAEDAQAPSTEEEPQPEDAGTGTNLSEVPAHSSSVAPPSTAPVSALSRPEVQLKITGIALTSAGALSALMGGAFLGRSGGLCHSYNEACSAGVALPIVGALWVGASVLPLVLGVSLWVPRTSISGGAPSVSGADPSGQKAAARPTLIVGPAGAAMRVEF